MKAIVLTAKWDPRPDFELGENDIEGTRTWQGSKVWRYPEVSIEDKSVPRVRNDEDVLVEVRACSICGSDIRNSSPDDEGYIPFPGLTAYPCTLGHEFSGVVVEAGEKAINKRKGKRFEKGEPVCSELRLWCGSCRPCVDGRPNSCEFPEFVGFTRDGGFAKYIVVNGRFLWSLSALEHVYRENDLFLAGSLVEITASAFNAVIMRGGGISPGENAVVLGGGPVGLAACTILRRQGAARVILYESNQAKAKLGLRMGASHIINPLSEDSVQRFLEITEGYGARFFLEATGQPDLSFPNIEEAIWRGKCINAKVVIAGLAWAGGKISVTGNIFQAREASVVGASGNSGYGIYPRVISAMASGMDMTPLITEKISLSRVPEKLIALRKDNKASKVIVINFDG